ncbi:hypothetical protein [Streptomyces sp. NPDC058299]|uniref:hypothetical protein n=1 Tax=unclassified Streptomyces TaxID=2593676 RepID=UPI0036E7E579
MSSRVLATISAEDIERHREALITWAEANGLDPRNVAQRPGLTIERTGTRTVICYREIQRNDQGLALMDPDTPDQAWTIKRAAPLRLPLPDLEQANPVTPSDHTPGGGPPP